MLGLFATVSTYATLPLSAGFSSAVEHKARHLLLVPHTRSDPIDGGKQGNFQQVAALVEEQWRRFLNLLSDRNGCARWQFFGVSPKRTLVSTSLARRTSPHAAGIFFCGVYEGLLRASSLKGLSKGTGRT
jgi:hypothetical protein